TRLAAHTAWEPVLPAQFVQHGTPYALAGISFELSVRHALITPGSVKQPHQTRLGQIVELNIGWQARSQLHGDATHQRGIMGNDLIFGSWHARDDKSERGAIVHCAAFSESRRFK